MLMPFSSVDQVASMLSSQGYIADRSLALALYLGSALKKPLLLEGEAGVGKTSVAPALSKGLGVDLIRLQCYEGIDANQALYEWNYVRQLLSIRLAESRGRKGEIEEVFGFDNLIKRPLLQAILTESNGPPVLLIDEIDRADEEFEAFLLEILSDYQVSIPELGTITAKQIPLVILTSNRTRDLHDALKRRCLYFWVEYPSLEREYEVVSLKVPGLGERLARDICAFVSALRREDMHKKPGLAETIDWALALKLLQCQELSPECVRNTSSCIAKSPEDMQLLLDTDRVRKLIQGITAPRAETGYCGTTC
ncbi:MAG: AAA family ATPase [Thermoleophilia bacterium]